MRQGAYVVGMQHGFAVDIEVGAEAWMVRLGWRVHGGGAVCR